MRMVSGSSKKFKCLRLIWLKLEDVVKKCPKI